jgi:hypothetical protein
VHAAGESGADVGDRRLAGGRIERGQLHGDLRARGIEERFDGFRARAHLRIFRQAAASTAVPCRRV